jgi:hypothetical protein|tara:strand:+ start:212 stop:397 length:186 start_codon:yes stop_codon:yes gene_type:complete
MSRTQRHISKPSNTINEESYALYKPTNATFITKETMETDTEKESIRQESEVISNESALVEN